MPPQNYELKDGIFQAEDDFGLVPEDEREHHHHHHLEERKLELNLKGIISNLRNLDYSKVVWRNVILFVLLHIYSLHGVYLAATSCMWKTLAFSFLLYFLGGLGITMGVHRLWSHRSYKAKFPLRLILAGCQTLAFQNSIFEWSRDHRVHHKYSETDADPHNANRGFFFSHMGWLMYRKHPDVVKKGKTLDVSDLLADPIVRFQHKFYLPLVSLVCFVLPTLIPWYYWGEGIFNCIMVPAFLRYTVTLHISWMVNSLAHWLGSKPYDGDIQPSQNPFVSTVALGEGWHNFHHVFPFDYRTAELGGLFNLNATAFIIDMFAKIGWAYDRKTVSKAISDSRAQRTGDGSHPSMKTKLK